MESIYAVIALLAIPITTVHPAEHRTKLEQGVAAAQAGEQDANGDEQIVKTIGVGW